MYAESGSIHSLGTNFVNVSGDTFGGIGVIQASFGQTFRGQTYENKTGLDIGYTNGIYEPKFPSSYKTSTSLEDGIKKTFHYIKKRGVRPFDYHINIEIKNEQTPETWLKKEI